MTHQLTTIVAGRNFVEAPRWHDGRIWFSDMYDHTVSSALEDGSDLRLEATVPQRPGGLAWLPDGRLLVVSMQDRKLMRREQDGTVTVHADLSDHVTGDCNDLVVDRAGRAYVGDFGFDLHHGAPMRTAALHRVDLDGRITQVADDLWFPNGCLITDSDVLIVNETFGNRISAFDVTADGELINRRIWAQFGPLPTATQLDEAMSTLTIAPDGMCADAAGALWIADLLSSRLLRVLEGGEVVDEISPGMMPFAAVVGGGDGKTLFIAVAPSMDEAQLVSEAQAAMLSARVAVGAPSQWPPTAEPASGWPRLAEPASSSSVTEAAS